MIGCMAAGDGIVAHRTVLIGREASAALGLTRRGPLAAGGCRGLSWPGLQLLRARIIVKVGAVVLCNMVGK